MRTISWILSLLVVLSGAALWAQSECSTENIRGTWAIWSQATTMITPAGGGQSTAAPMASLGVVEMDYGGRLSGALTLNVGGDVIEAEFINAKAEINADCTGTVQYSLKARDTAAGPGRMQFFMTDEGKQIESIVVEGAAGKPIETHTWRRLSRLPLSQFKEQSTCSLDMLRGTWGVRSEGVQLTAPGVGVPMAYMGVVSISNSGAGGLVTAMIGGEKTELELPPGAVSLKVNPDCTGLLSLRLKPAGSDTAVLPGEGLVKFVILDGGTKQKAMYLRGVVGMPVNMETVFKLSATPDTCKWPGH